MKPAAAPNEKILELSSFFGVHIISMKSLILCCVLLAFCSASCVTKSKANAKARDAFLAGKQQGLAMQPNAASVWVVGNVKTPLIPWTEDLTLVHALIAADYQGAGDPGQIVLMRNGQPANYISARQLLNGFDLPLRAGDRIEVRP